jgi:hypothetical protein
MKGTKYSNDELLRILKQYHDKFGHSKAHDFTNKNGLPSYSVYIKRFSTWNNAKQLAGIDGRFIEHRRQHTKEDIIKQYNDLYKQMGKLPTSDDIRTDQCTMSYHKVLEYFGGIDGLREACNLQSRYKQGKYTTEFLLSEIHRFYSEFKYVPTAIDLDGVEGYPSRQTFTKHFGKFENAVYQAGFIPENQKYYNSDFLISEIERYIDEFGVLPTCEDIDKNNNYPTRHHYRTVFGSWNSALKAAGIPIQRISLHDDTFLETEFHRFVVENNRVPSTRDFNKSEYPSFWCYQERFGGWNNAVVHYGYEPNDSTTKYTLDDGEICASQYELLVSQWLKEHSIRYDRDINYCDFIKNYHGKMNCDYKLYIGDEIWYVEVAGFIRNQDIQTYSSEEMEYYRRLTYKEKLLKREGLNYLFVYLWDLNERELVDIFYFIE